MRLASRKHYRKMKRVLLGITLLFLSGCSSTDIIIEEEGAIITDGRIVRKVGQLNCRMTVVTDRYGIFDTGRLSYDECENFFEGSRVRVKIIRGQLELMYTLDRSS